MISSDMTISLATWALNLEKERATVSAQNIASASSGGVRRTGNFDELINRMSDAVKNGSTTDIERLLNTKSTTMQDQRSGIAGKTSLDETIIEISRAKGKFKVISEALAKKYALMNLSVASK